MALTQPVQSISGDRARTLKRYAEDGAALRKAMDAAGASIADVAAAWGVSLTRVSECIAGLKPLSWQKVTRLPPAVRLALLAPEVARASAETAQLANDLLLIAACADSETAPALATALADGAITRSETPRIRAAALKEIAERQAVILRCDQADAAGADAVRMWKV